MNRTNLIKLGLIAGILVLSANAAEIVRAQNSPSSAASQDAGSKIIGRVLSADSGEPLAYANVSVFKTNPAAGDTLGAPFGGAMTAQDGSYRIVCPPGSYRLVIGFVGFNQQKIYGIDVADRAAATVDVSLTSNAMTLETIEVQSTRERASDMAILAKQKRAPAVSDGIGAQQIKKSPDSNAADVLKRVTGVSTVGGKYIYVRGLGERYSATQVNGSTISSPEPNKKVVPLDIFAAGLLDNVVIQKTYTPDQPGEFAGGVVNLSTRDFPGQRIWELSVSTGSNSETSSNDFLHYEGSDTDFLGFDDGARGLPDLVQKLAKNKKLEQRGIFDPAGKGFSSDTLAMLGQSFSNTWGVERADRALSNYGLNATYGDEIPIFGRTMGLIASASYTNSAQTTQAVERVFTDDGTSVRNDFETTTSEAATLWGAILNSSYRLNQFNTLNLRSMYNRSSEDEVRFAQGYADDWSRNAELTRLQYVERGVLTSSLGMNHTITPLRNSTLEWKVSYSNAERNEPDRREYAYEENSRLVRDEDDRIVDTLQVYEMSSRSRPSRQFGSMDEDERGYEAALSVPFRQWSGLEAKFKGGAVLKNRDRSFEWRRFGYELPTLQGGGINRDSVLALPAAEFLGVDMIGGPADTRDHVWLRENTNETDAYLASQDQTAGFLMVDLPLSQRLRSVVGARVENAEMSNRTYDRFSGLESTSAKLDDQDVLPALNLTYSLNEDANLRAAFSRTVSRPDLRELSSFALQDVVTRVQEIGNPDLKRALISNYDLRYETYPTSSEMAAVSVFYKDFENAIEKSVLLGSLPVYKPVNAKSASVLGAEFEGRVGLGRLSSRLESLFLNANLTIVESEAELDESTGVQFSNRRPLEGQSPYVINSGIYYASSSGKTNAAFLYNRFGRRLQRVGLEVTPDIYEEARGSLDFTLAHAFRTFRVKLSARNLTNEETQYAHENAGTTYAARTGRSISFAVSTGS